MFLLQCPFPYYLSLFFGAPYFWSTHFTLSSTKTVAKLKLHNFQEAYLLPKSTECTVVVRPSSHANIRHTRLLWEQVSLIACLFQRGLLERCHRSAVPQHRSPICDSYRVAAGRGSPGSFEWLLSGPPWPTSGYNPSNIISWLWTRYEMTSGDSFTYSQLYFDCPFLPSSTAIKNEK